MDENQINIETKEELQKHNRKEWIKETAFEFTKIAYSEADHKLGVPDIADMGVSMAVALANSLESELGSEAWD